VFTSLSATSGEGAVEYDSLSDLPGSPTDGEQAIVNGMLLVATGGVWQFQSPQTPCVTVSESPWGNVANTLDFVVLTFEVSPEIPTSTTAWSAVP
jgi:hypothetical protein